MSFFKFLFSRAKKNSEDNKGLAEHLDRINLLRKPAIALSRCDGKPFSKIGGLPDMPMNLAWPEWKEAPLAFLCQLDLSEIPKECSQLGLPASGRLYFFYDQEQRTWGFDPKDKGSWKVLYSTSPASECTQQKPPKGLSKDYIYREKPVNLLPIQTYPDWQDERIEMLNLTDKQGDEYTELCCSVFENKTFHHILGYPSPVQGNNMDLECQLASNGLYCGDGSGYKDKRAKELEPGRDEWVMLLQIDTDDDAEMMWGDGGKLYFWIKKSDLEAGCFENCWMILQCY